MVNTLLDIKSNRKYSTKTLIFDHLYRLTHNNQDDRDLILHISKILLGFKQFDGSIFQDGGFVNLELSFKIFTFRWWWHMRANYFTHILFFRVINCLNCL